VTDPSSRWTTDIPTVIELHVGDGTEIPLASAAGAGNQWTVEPVTSKDVAEVFIRQGEAPAPQPEGNPPSTYVVPETLIVRAARPGRGTWRLRLARPWTPDEVVADHEMHVVVI
jgi:hypothetical protein